MAAYNKANRKGKGKVRRVLRFLVQGVSSKHYQGNEDERPPGILLLAGRRA